jgi:hypothetical protein
MISFTPGYFGWLGNQMFQYATTFAASKRANTECGFPENKPNLFELFNLSAKKQQTPLSYFYQEPHFHYSEIPTYITELTLHGYFQSEKYFSEYKDEIKSEFTLLNPKFDDESLPEFIALHVRRGDYLDLQYVHPVCTVEYYEKALNLLPNLPVYVFSDDIDWCKQTFTDDRFSFFNGNFIEDFELMSKGSYHIIANSSFSWWAAWLSDSKKVIAPTNWFGPKGPGSAEDIVPDTWIKI